MLAMKAIYIRYESWNLDDRPEFVSSTSHGKECTIPAAMTSFPQDCFKPNSTCACANALAQSIAFEHCHLPVLSFFPFVLRVSADSSSSTLLCLLPFALAEVVRPET
jgi:hypothetical protein